MDDSDKKHDLIMRFISGKQIDPNDIRPEILESWKRSRKKVDPFKKRNTTILSENELKELRIKYQEFIEVTLPVMQQFYEVINDVGVEVILMVMEGSNLIILETVGDDEALNQAKSVNAIPGSNWAEDIMGTNAGVLSVIEDKPYQLHPSENYLVFLRNNTMSAAPIHDPDTNATIGSLIIAGNDKLVHPHTLGMIAALVKFIEKQMATNRLKNKAEIESNYKTLIMESISSGIIAVDEKMSITHVNQKALDIFRIKEDPLGHNILSMLANTFGTASKPSDLLNVIKMQEEVNDEFIHVQNDFGIIRFTLTSRCIRFKNKFIGKIFIMQEMSHIKNLVARTIGNYATITFNELIGEDEKFLNCIATANRVANSYSTVLLLGQSGTGKDLFAQSIHNASGRGDQPYIAINCAAIPRELLASELFGYVEGAFTGAKKGGNPGKFELADGGTMFLDEIGDMPLDMQTSLLRVLEERAVTRVGGKTPLPINVRIIAATNKDLSKEVEKGSFREDLYYRLNVVSISLPPLKERRGDILLLIDYIVKRISSRLGISAFEIDDDFVMACSLYDWPGNIRELQNIIERCINLANDRTLTLDLLPEHIAKNNATMLDQSGPGRHLKSYTRTIESRVIKDYLKKYNNVDLVAKELGISRSTLYRRLNKDK